ncbi:MAG: hypothetical protein AAFN07_07305 [Pseudomonadota bacterium]
MSETPDTDLQALFDAQPTVPDDSDFVSQTMAQTDLRRYRLIGARVSVLLAIIALELLLESPIQQSMGMIGSILTRPVVALEGEWLGFLLDPINSVAGLLGVILLGIHWMMRKILH